MSEVPIRPASTVVVLRDSSKGVELFLVRRNFSIAFMAGAHVFPGGRVDAADADIDAGWCDLPAPAVARRLPALAFAVAALRELFEEAAVLLARTADGAFVRCDEAGTRERFARYRTAVHDGTMTLRAVVEAEGLRLALDAVQPFAHWVTPPIEVRRFDTWFFAAAVPQGQEPEHDRGESVDSGWFTPSEALDACRRRRINLPPPTWATLRELEPFDTVASALEWARTREIVARQPAVRHEHGAREILLPGDPAHPATELVAYETRFIWADGRWLPDARRD